MRRLVALGIALAGCGTEPSEPFEPATYVLQSIGGRSMPAEYASMHSPTTDERSLFLYDTVTIVSDTQFVRSFRVIHLRVPSPFVDTVGQSAHYTGTILHRDDAILLVPPGVLPPSFGFDFGVETIELKRAGPALRRRIRSSEYQCPSEPLAPCEALRDELVDALYVRR